MFVTIMGVCTALRIRISHPQVSLRLFDQCRRTLSTRKPPHVICSRFARGTSVIRLFFSEVRGS